MRAADSFRLFCGVLSVLKSMHSRGITVRRVRPSMLRITSNGVIILKFVRAACSQYYEGSQFHCLQTSNNVCVALRRAIKMQRHSDCLEAGLIN